MFGRAAWAHDWQNTPQASATFLGVSPIAAFIVNGAKPAADLGVVTAGAELRMASGWALMGEFDGEFGSGTQTYAGTKPTVKTRANSLRAHHRVPEIAVPQPLPDAFLIGDLPV